MTNLITRYRSLLDEISTKFGALMDKQGEWTTDYTLWCTEWEAWSVPDMLYILKNYGYLYRSTNKYAKADLVGLRNDVQAWLDYNVDVAQFGIKYINLKSWLSGASRMSREQIEHLRELRNNFLNTCEEFREEYGELDTSSQPKHLRTLKDKK